MSESLIVSNLRRNRAFELSNLLILIIDLVIGSFEFCSQLLNELVLGVDLVFKTNDLLPEIMDLGGLAFIVELKFILEFGEMGNFV